MLTMTKFTVEDRYLHLMQKLHERISENSEQFSMTRFCVDEGVDTKVTKALLELHYLKSYHLKGKGKVMSYKWIAGFPTKADSDALLRKVRQMSIDAKSGASKEDKSKVKAVPKKEELLEEEKTFIRENEGREIYYMAKILKRDPNTVSAYLGELEAERNRRNSPEELHAQFQKGFEQLFDELKAHRAALCNMEEMISELSSKLS